MTDSRFKGMMSNRRMGPATENLFRDVHDDSTPHEKALFHFLSYVHEHEEHNLDLSLTLEKVERELARSATEGAQINRAEMSEHLPPDDGRAKFYDATGDPNGD